MALAYIGIGSNLDEPRRHVEDACRQLAELPLTRRQGVSALYRSRPMGPPGQPDYINAVVVLETALEPDTLLTELKALERRHGRREGGAHWGPRPLDLDILVYGDLRRSDAELTIPHAGLAQRNFVISPLHDVAPNLDIPGLGRVTELFEQCSMEGIECLEPVT